VGWSEFDPKDREEKRDAQSEKHQEHLRALGTAAKRGIAGEKQDVLLRFLQSRANSVSYRPGASAEEVAFNEGQRSLALQLLKLAGEV